MILLYLNTRNTLYIFHHITPLNGMSIYMHFPIFLYLECDRFYLEKKKYGLK